MKNSLVVALLFSIALTCGGCFDFEEEIWLNKDRSGKYALKLSASSGPIASLLRMSAKKENDSSRMSEQSPNPTDTLWRFADLPDTIKTRFPYPQVLDQTTMRMSMSKGFDIQFDYTFKDVSELSKLWENLNTFSDLRKDSTLQGMEDFKILAIGNIKTMFFGIPEVQFDGKKLHRTSAKTDTFSRDIKDMEDPALGNMFFRNKTYRLIYHMPKKVRRIQGDGFIKEDKKTVIGTFPLLEVMENRQILDCRIQIK